MEPGRRIRDRYTGRIAPGLFVLGDDYGDGPCPECGAEEGQQCSVEDVDNPGLGIEISPYIHVQRADAWEAGLDAKWCESVMKGVTRENAQQVLTGLLPEQRAFFEWWFTMRFGDRIPKPGEQRIYLQSYCGGEAQAVARQESLATDIQSRYGAMHRAILTSREPQ